MIYLCTVTVSFTLFFQVNIWDYSIKPSSIRKIAKCQANHRGNVLSTDTTRIQESNVTVDVVNIATFCKHTPDFVVIPEVMAKEEAKKFCHRLNSSLYVPEDEESNNELFRDSQKFLDVCGVHSYKLLHLGATDEPEEGVWTRVDDGFPLSFHAWAPGEPNGARGGNCLIMRKSDGKWNDNLCSLEQCFSCLRTHRDFLLIRGLCELREDMTRFLLTGYMNGKPFFRGAYKYIIFYTNDQLWLLHNTMTNVTLAALTPRHLSDYPVGRREWQVLSPFCDFTPGKVVVIGLSACTNDQFMCSDGSCVPRAVRCNMQDDCVDGSDEENCRIVKQSDKYSNHRPPPSGTFGLPLGIEPLVDLVRFSKVDDINLAYNIEIEVTLAWRDRNLKFLNVRSEESKNKLSEKHVQEIWTPDIEFLNTYDGQLKNLKSVVTVQEKNPADVPDFNDVMMGNDQINGVGEYDE